MNSSDFVFYFNLGILFILLFLSIFKIINSNEKKIYSFFTIAVICQIIKYLTALFAFHETFMSSLMRALVAIFLILYNIQVIKIKNKITLNIFYIIIATIIAYFFLEINNQTPPIDIVYKKIFILGSGIEIAMFSVFLYSSIRLKSYFLYKISYAVLLIVCLYYTSLMVKIVFFKVPQNQIFSPLLTNLFKSSYIFEMVMFFVSRFFFEEKMIHRSVILENQILQNELEKKQSIEQERERISHDMHDDLGAGISALKLQTEFLHQKLKGNLDLQKDVEELLKTSEEMNLSMREMIWTLNSENDNLQKFVHYVTFYAENFFKKSEIKINVEKEGITNKEITSETRRNLFLCVKESLNNIYKHSNAKNVYLNFNQTENQLNFEIKDDGIGLQKVKNSGNGFKNMKFRMQESCGEFEILPSEKGLHLKFHLPL